MSQSRIPSPARSQGVAMTPRRQKIRKTRSVGSPARSTASGRLSSVIQFQEKNLDSFHLSPMPTRRSVLNDDTDIAEETRRRSWWKKLSNSSRDVMEVFNDNKILETNEAVEEYIDIEVLSQEKKNYTLDIPESSDSESISSIVIPQRKLFTQKDQNPPPTKKFGQLVGTRESLAKLHKTTGQDKTLNVAPKNLFNHASKAKSKPVFPAELLNVSPNKTANKTREMAAAEVRGQVRSLFGNRAGTKRKNMFTDFIVSESEDEISEIQPKVFGFQKKGDHQTEASNIQRRDPSPTSSITTDIEMDDWKLLPSSTMVENQLEAMMATAKTPVKKPRLSKLSMITESGTVQTTNKSFDKTRQSSREKSHNSPEIIMQSKKQNKSVIPDIFTEDAVEDIVVENQKQLVEAKHVENQKDIEMTNYGDHNVQKEVNEEINNKSGNTQADIERANNRSIGSSKTLSKTRDSEPTKHVNTSSNKTMNKSKTSDKIKSVEALTKSPTIQTSDTSINRFKTNKSLSFLNVAKDNRIQNQTSQEQIKGDKQALKQKSIIEKDYENVGQIQEDIQRDVRENNEDENIEALHYESDEDIQNDEVNHTDNVQGKTFERKEEGNNNQKGDSQSVNNQSSENREQMQHDSDPEDENNDELQYEDENREAINENVDHDEPHEDSGEDKQLTYEESDQEDIEQFNESQKEQYQAEKVLEISQGNQKENQEKSQFVQDKGVDEHKENKQAKSQNDQVVREDKEEEEIQVQQKESQDEQAMSEDEQEIQEEQLVSEDEQVVAEDEQEENLEKRQEEQVVSEDEELENQEESQEEQAVSEDEEIEEENEESQEEQVESADEQEETEEEKEESQEEQVASEDEEIEESQEEQVVSENEEEIQEENEESQDEQPMSEDEQEQSQDNQEADQELDQAESSAEIEDTNEDDEHDYDDNVLHNDIENKEPDDNVSHDTTGRHREKGRKSPEAVLHDKTKQMESFMAKGRNTSLRRTSIMKSMSIRTSLAPPRESTGLSDGTRNSSAEGSGWDSHRTTRKTLRQTFGKDFSPRKSLRALVMEKSAKRQTAITDLTSVTSKFPQANSTELPEASNIDDDEPNAAESNHDLSKRTRQTTLEMYLQKIKKQNLERKLKMEEAVRNSLKAPLRDSSNLFKVPARPPFAARKSTKQVQSKPKAKPIKSALICFNDLPPEVQEDMKYKPPKRFQPSNASWITKRLYKFLETKLEPRYDYKARVRAEKLVESIYHFAKELRRQEVASADAVNVLKHEMARLDVVKTHFEFYQFFKDYMPREIRIKVVPDIVNKIPVPRQGVFSDILRENTVQG